MYTRPSKNPFIKFSHSWRRSLHPYNTSRHARKLMSSVEGNRRHQTFNRLAYVNFNRNAFVYNYINASKHYYRKDEKEVW